MSTFFRAKMFIMTLPWGHRVATLNLGPIGSAVLKLIGHTRTDIDINIYLNKTRITFFSENPLRYFQTYASNYHKKEKKIS